MKVEHTFHQSWLDNFLNCPERARLVLAGQYPGDQTDATAKGTATHTAIEAVVERCDSYEDALQAGVDRFREISAEPDFRWVQVKRERTALLHIEQGFHTWYKRVYPSLKATIWCEREFRFLFHEDEVRRIYLGGTVDYADSEGLKDWKLTGNRDKYTRDAWKLQKFALQPTVYAAAAYELGLYDRSEVVPFEFVAMPTGGQKPYRVQCERTAEHMSWLRQQCVSVAEHIEADLPRWHLNDQSALCSPKWCGVWDKCKGAHFEREEAVSVRHAA